jgi:enterochelin esterase-like enzyme
MHPGLPTWTGVMDGLNGSNPGTAGTAPVSSSTPGSTLAYHVIAYRPHDPAKVRVDVSLAKQQVYVMEGDRCLMAAACCVGLPQMPTPKGHFKIIEKIPDKRSGAYGYQVSNGVVTPCSASTCHGSYVGYPMPFWCGFAHGYGFHQGYVWPTPHTHGVIRLDKQAAPRFFELMQTGTPIEIADTQPEDATVGRNVQRPDDYREPDSTAAFMISPGPFEKPPGTLLIDETAATRRPTPPTREPNTPGFVTAKELPDGTNPPVDADGDFIIGPSHHAAPEIKVQPGVPQGAVYEFTMSSSDSKIYPGIARDPGTHGVVDPRDSAKLLVTTSHPAPYTRRVAVYVPRQYVGEVAPFIVGADGPERGLFTALDNLIAEHKVPVMIAISIGNGGGDAQGSERGLEYDTMSGRYAEFVETEILPLVEKHCGVRLTRDPDARATMGGSSGGSCALIMAWYHPDLYHRVLTYSGTYVNQQWPFNPATPHGAWEFHEHLIPESPVNPLRIWMEVGDRDLLNPNVMRDGMHDWVLANDRMAKALAARGYHYQFLFARNAGHVDGGVKQQTLPEALEWLWRGYPAAK